MCISAHWHLGVLLLADLIEHIDNHNLGIPSHSHARTSSKWVLRVRERSATELSDLARAAAPGITTAPQLSDFHHAINESMLLTEPWTIILIRAFSKAGNFWLGEASGLIRCECDEVEVSARLDRAEDCVRGLWTLGKKSDSARRCAETLSRAKRKVVV